MANTYTQCYFHLVYHIALLYLYDIQKHTFFSVLLCDFSVTLCLRESSADKVCVSSSMVFIF
jgi:hypothetical protein